MHFSAAELFFTAEKSLPGKSFIPFDSRSKKPRRAIVLLLVKRKTVSPSQRAI